MSRTSARVRAGASVTAATLLTVVLSAGPALANTSTRNPLAPQEGADSSADISTSQALLLYGVIPLAILLLLSAIVWLPGAVRSSRYRPQRGWSAAPVWFGGPADPVAAVETAVVGTEDRGGARGDW
ncbi:MAG: hypothetical protein JWM64_1241 [Frankiales bacterium]|nr:hypothetical protein [Frankiales bacterium]